MTVMVYTRCSTQHLDIYHEKELGGRLLSYYRPTRIQKIALCSATLWIFLLRYSCNCQCENRWPIFVRGLFDSWVLVINCKGFLLLKGAANLTQVETHGGAVFLKEMLCKSWTRKEVELFRSFMFIFLCLMALNDLHKLLAQQQQGQERKPYPCFTW